MKHFKTLLLSTYLIGCDHDPQVITSFQVGVETPESLAVDHNNDIVVSLALTAEIRKIDQHTASQSTLATLPILNGPLEPCFDAFGVMLALTVDKDDNVYVSGNSCDPELRGIWKVTPEGSPSLFARVPTDAFINGVAVFEDYVYTADGAGGRIFRAPLNGSLTDAEVWISSPLLTLVPNEFGAPGANGIQFYKHEAVVSNSSTAQLLTIPVVESSQEAGEVTLRHQLSVGCDDFSFDIPGNIYCTTNPFQTIVRVAPDGTETILYDVEDGLDGPTSTVFGRGLKKDVMFFSNAAFPFVPNSGHGPSVMAVKPGAIGWPGR